MDDENYVVFPHTVFRTKAQAHRYYRVLKSDICAMEDKDGLVISTLNFPIAEFEKESEFEACTVPVLYRDNKTNDKPQYSGNVIPGEDMNQTVNFPHVRIVKQQQADRYFSLLYENVKYIVDKCGTKWNRSEHTYRVEYTNFLTKPI